MENEQWNEIPSLPEYEASSWGRVRRKVYTKEMPHGGVREYGGKAHFGAFDARARRFQFVFRQKTYRVHRVVCEAFHGPAPFEGAVVMHLDEDSTNNRPENLCWGTQKQNLNAPGFIDYCRSRTGESSPVIKGTKRKEEEHGNQFI